MYELNINCNASDNEVLSPFLYNICTIESIVSLKSCLNLCSCEWVKFNLTRVSSLIPLVSCIVKPEFSFGQVENCLFRIIW